jgi:hypothetical protein
VRGSLPGVAVAIKRQHLKLKLETNLRTIEDGSVDCRRRSGSIDVRCDRRDDDRRSSGC